MAAAAIAGVDRVYAIGGAQAVGALAYGTETIAQVDKIVARETPTSPRPSGACSAWWASTWWPALGDPGDLRWQHRPGLDRDGPVFRRPSMTKWRRPYCSARTPLSSEAVVASIGRLLPQMPRREVIAASLKARGALIQVRSLEEACAIANRIAPEHLELAVAEPEQLVERIRHAGAIFIGGYSPRRSGLLRRANHVLPTSRSARFPRRWACTTPEALQSDPGIQAGAQTPGPHRRHPGRGRGPVRACALCEYRLDK